MFAQDSKAKFFMSGLMLLSSTSAPPWNGPKRRATIGDAGGDRKSTRLNSSHRCISYAVFCLKKKKKKEAERKNKKKKTSTNKRSPSTSGHRLEQGKKDRRRLRTTVTQSRPH